MNPKRPSFCQDQNLQIGREEEEEEAAAVREMFLYEKKNPRKWSIYQLEKRI